MPNENLSKREANKLHSRTAILRASRRLFTEQGYEQAMIRDIAARAGVSKATVYNYFPNKESLLIGTVEDTLQEMRDDLNSEECRTMDGEARLRRTMHTLIFCHRKYPALGRRITLLNSDRDSRLYGCDREMMSILRQLVIECQEDGIYRPEERPERIVDYLLGLYFIAQFRWIDIQELAEDEVHQRIDADFDDLMQNFRIS